MLQMNMCWITNAEACVRWGIVKLKADGVAHPFAISEILDNFGTTGHATALSQRNPLFLNTYQIIKGGKFTMNPLAGTDSKKKTISFNIKLRSRTFYTTSGLGNPGYGHYHFFAISDVDVGAVQPKVSFSARVFFVDN